MGETDFFKHKYASQWAKSDARELIVQLWVAAHTPYTASKNGAAITGTGFVPGSAAQNGKFRSAPDLVLSDGETVIEVTGTDKCKPEDDLWIRPDKIEKARESLPSHATWIAHYLDNHDTLRFIRIDKEFLRRYDAGEFGRVSFENGYIAIPASDPCIWPPAGFAACMVF